MEAAPAEILYSKQLTQSDAACSKQIKLPRNEAKKFVGDLRHKQSAALVVKDANGGYWEFICTCYGCQYALSKVGAFAKAFNLKPGDTLSFFRDQDHELCISVNRGASAPAQPRATHGTRRKRSPSHDEHGSPVKHPRGSAIADEGPASPCASPTLQAAAEAGHDPHTSAFSKFHLAGTFSGSSSCPSSPTGFAVGPGQAAGYDAARAGLDAHAAWQNAQNLQAMLLLQTMESLNAGPALFKAPSAPPPVHRSLGLDLRLTPLQLPDCLSPSQPSKQLCSPSPLERTHSHRGGQDCSNLSEDTHGRLDMLEDSTAGCSTPEGSPTSMRRMARSQVILSKQLSRMDVRCAHDSVGITLAREDVLASQLMDDGCAVRHFNVVDQHLGTVYPCTLALSADGRFGYLTGLGPFLHIHSAEPGQSFVMAVAFDGTVTVAMHQ